MKRKVIIISISILLVLGIILSINSAPKDKIYLNKNNIKENNKSLAIYLEQENGSYSKTTTFPNKSDKYVLNKSKSVCSGNTNISWNSEEWGLELSNIDREETKCFLYFDKGKTIDDIIPTLNAKTETPDFSQVATTDEGVYITDDPMYGTNAKTYYWRGAATTNYLKFANFCWRIVRINGDKTIRLIYDGTTCHQNGETTTDSLAVSNVQYNLSRDKSYYVGWTFDNTQRTLSGTESNAKTQLESWFNNNISEINMTKIADGKYCNDRSVVIPSESWGWNSNYTTVWAQTGTNFSYASAKRVWELYTPSVECFLEDTYILKVGLITADEVEMAGGKSSNNASFYLFNGQKYWTISPCWWVSYGNAYMFFVSEKGYLNSYFVDYDNHGLRPVINLNSDIILSGDGTIDSPYEVF